LLKASEQQLARQQALLSVETERRRLALVETDRDVKALELLKERQHNEHLKEERRRDTKELDEAAIVRQSRSETAVAT
jgi:flagellar export protein FliJ